MTIGVTQHKRGGAESFLDLKHRAEPVMSAIRDSTTTYVQSMRLKQNMLLHSQ